MTSPNPHKIHVSQPINSNPQPINFVTIHKKMLFSSLDTLQKEHTFPSSYDTHKCWSLSHIAILSRITSQIKHFTLSKIDISHNRFHLSDTKSSLALDCLKELQVNLQKLVGTQTTLSLVP